MDPRNRILFPPYEIDPARHQLLRGGQPIALRQKAFAVLQYLAARPGELVRKEELLDAIWPGTFVGEGALAGCIRELRQALGDSAREPRFIETAHRLGYRFIAEIRPATSSEDPSSTPTPIGLPGDSVVGRAAEIAELQRCFELAWRGERQVVFVSGPPGIGKTSLVDHFVSSFVSRRSSLAEKPVASAPHTNNERSETSNVLLGRGQCLDQRGVPESFLPVFDALGDLCRAPGGLAVTELLRKHVPACLPLISGLLDATASQGVSIEPAQPERMARLLVEVLEMISEQRPLLLVLEDLHWSDEASLMFLSHLARRSAPARMMVIATYRPIDIIVSRHPLRTLHQELIIHRRCLDLALGFLDVRSVRDWLAVRIGEVDLLDDLASWLYQRTEGSPLFLVNVFEHLLAQGCVSRGEEQWVILPGFEAVGLPESLRLMIEGYLEILRPEERQLLEAASVIGLDFSAAAIAACLQQEVVAVEHASEAFLRRTHLIVQRPEVEWPDGTVSAGYGFVHALYQEVIYDQLGAARRAQLHLRLGERLEQALVPGARETAAILAVHFERGRDARRAAGYHHHAGVGAIQRSMPSEAAEHLSAALRSLATLTPSSETRHQELATQIALMVTMSALKGYSAPETAGAVRRAYQLCMELGDRENLGPALGGMWGVHNGRAEYHESAEFARRLIRLGEETAESTGLLWGHMMLALSLSWMGELSEGYASFERGVTFYDPSRDRLGRHIFQDPMELGADQSAWVLWAMGRPDQALALGEEMLAGARDRDRSPYSTMRVLDSLTVQHVLRRERARVGDLVNQLISLCAEYPNQLILNRGRFARAWVDAVEAPGAESLKVLHDRFAVLSAAATVQGRSYHLMLVADAQLRADQLDEALSTLDEAFDFVAGSDERFFAAELHRLRGEGLARQGKTAAAEQSLLQGLQVARAQQARSWELRCAVDLARLWKQQDRARQAFDLLAPIHAWFTEGFATPDLQSARTLLDELIRPGG